MRSAGVPSLADIEPRLVVAGLSRLSCWPVAISGYCHHSPQAQPPSCKRLTCGLSRVPSMAGRGTQFNTCRPWRVVLRLENFGNSSSFANDISILIVQLDRDNIAFSGSVTPDNHLPDRTANHTYHNCTHLLLPSDTMSLPMW